MWRVLMVTGGLAGAGAVGMAAAASHALAGRLDAKGAAAVGSAVQMQGWHALALLGTGLWLLHAKGLAHTLGSLAGAAFGVGLVLFCGAVYAHQLGGVASGPVAPAGGVLLIAAWLLVAASALAGRPS